jgi:hypothetical protein
MESSFEWWHSKYRPAFSRIHSGKLENIPEEQMTK